MADMGLILLFLPEFLQSLTGAIVMLAAAVVGITVILMIEFRIKSKRGG